MEHKTMEFGIPKTKRQLVVEILKRWWYKYQFPQECNRENNIEGYPGLILEGPVVRDTREGFRPSYQYFKSKGIPELAKILEDCLLLQI